MLFLLKRRALPALLLFAAIAVAGVALREDLVPDGLGPWSPRPVALGLLAVAASDGVLHGLLTLALGRPYASRYRLLVDFFREQGPLAIASGGLLAAAEELLFRGGVLAALVGPLGRAGALAASSVAFGLAHLIPDRRLAPFMLWAVWEGALLGAVYLWSGSLAVAMTVHALHDVGGFALFAVQRRTGWLLAPA